METLSKLLIVIAILFVVIGIIFLI